MVELRMQHHRMRETFVINKDINKEGAISEQFVIVSHDNVSLRVKIYVFSCLCSSPFQVFLLLTSPGSLVIHNFFPAAHHFHHSFLAPHFNK